MNSPEHRVRDIEKRLAELEDQERQLGVYAVASQVADDLGLNLDDLLRETDRLAAAAELNGWTVEDELRSELGAEVFEQLLKS